MEKEKRKAPENAHEKKREELQRTEKSVKAVFASRHDEDRCYRC